MANPPKANPPAAQATGRPEGQADERTDEEREQDRLSAEARLAELEAENARLAAIVAAGREPGQTRQAWIVTYPAISLQRKDDAGKPVGDPVVFERGTPLPAEFEAQGPFLRSIGHVTALQVPA